VTWVDHVATGTTGLDLRLDPAQQPRGSLRARLGTESGTPVPEVALSVTHEDFGRVAQVRIPADQPEISLEHLPAGSLTVELFAVGFQPLRVQDLLLAAGEARTLPPLLLRPLP